MAQRTSRHDAPLHFLATHHPRIVAVARPEPAARGPASGAPPEPQGSARPVRLAGLWRPLLALIAAPRRGRTHER